MKRLILLFLISCSLHYSCNTSCITKEGFISSYDTFIEESIEAKNGDFIASEKHFESFTKECYEKFHSKMTNKEKIHFWKQTLKYQSEKYGYYNNDDILSPELQEALERDLETFTLESKQELIKIFKDEVAPELNNAIDEVVKGIEELGESLKDWLKEIEK